MTSNQRSRSPSPPPPSPHVNRWKDGFDLEQADTSSLTAYVHHRIWVYNRTGLRDYSLWEQFQEDFDRFTEDSFKEIDLATLRSFRDILRNSGVFLPAGRGNSIARNLFQILQEEEPTPWTKEAIQELVTKHGMPLSPLINNLIATGGNNLVFGITAPSSALPTLRHTPAPSLPTATVFQPRDVPKDSARDITNLSKIYSDNTQKYGGHGDSFDTQSSLDATLRTDLFLHSKLVTACQDTRACEFACFKTSPTLTSLIADLQSSIDTYEKTHAPPATPTSSAFFTNRRFHQPYRDERRPFPSRPFPSRYPPPRFKSKCCQALRELIDTNKINLNTKRWVERSVD